MEKFLRRVRGTSSFYSQRPHLSSTPCRLTPSTPNIGQFKKSFPRQLVRAGVPDIVKSVVKDISRATKSNIVNDENTFLCRLAVETLWLGG